MARSRLPAVNPAAYGSFADDRFGYVSDELVRGERIGPPPFRNRGRILRRGILLLLVAAGGAWAWYGDPVNWSGWRKIASVAASLESRLSWPSEATAKPVVRDTRPPVAQLPPLREEAPVARSAPPPLTTASLPPPAPAAVEPLEPPAADPADPYQVRALSVGLHPGLSRALLERLSAEDYRNAEHAVRTAMTETSDKGVFVWPRQRKPEQALFQVRFVAGAAPECRRYVVTVTKDGWLTTALPMERCGAQPRSAGRG